MRYSEAKAQIKNGDILLFEGQRFHSWLIMLRTKSRFSHAGIAHWIKSDGVERLAIVEALEGRGIQIFPLSEYVNSGEKIHWFKIVDDSINRDKVVGWAMQKWGKRYASPWQFVRSFGFLSKLILDWLRVPTKLDKNRWFCSHFTAKSLCNGGWIPDTADKKAPEQVTPGDMSLFTCLKRMGQIEPEKES